MRNKNALLAAGLSAAVLAPAAGCSDSHETVLRVGQSRWVHVAEDASNKNYSFKAGEECVVVRGATLVLKGGGVVYEQKNSAGTECPNGAEIRMARAEAHQENRQYRRFVARREVIESQVAKMQPSADSTLVPAPHDWVRLVNAEPVPQHYRNDDVELHYGSTCFASGQAEKIGELAGGEIVMSIVNPKAFGTTCPTGAEYLAHAHRSL
ncbi:MAG TPA: hypothetical protein VG604_00075 [Candidatus Saccharimonadales bacterium]|nr:hypothetical protein [Candidatus Saccharimonadales bacterium]